MAPKFLLKQDGSFLTQYLIVASVCVVAFTTGIHLSWLAPSLPKLFSSEYPFEITEEEASYIAIVSPIGHVIGGFLSSYLYDAIGRKKTLLLIAGPQMVSFSLISFSYYGVYLLYLARIVGGVSEGAFFAIAISYIAEITDPSVRGILGVMTNLTCLSGFLFINLLGSFVRIYETAAICNIFPIIFLLTFSYTPESPYYLLMKNRTKEAEESLKILRRKNNVEKELLQLTSDVNRQMTEKGTFKDLFCIASNRKAFCLSAIARTFQQWTGITAFAPYFQIILANTTDISPILSSSCLMLVQCFTVLASAFYINRFNRNTISVWSAIITGLSLGAFALHVTIRDYTSLDISSLSWLPLVYLVVLIIAIQGGLGVTVNILMGEIFSTSIKSKAYSVLSVVLAFYMLTSTKFFQYTSDNIGLAVPLWTFTVITFLGAFFFKFVLLETKDKSLEEIQQELKGHGVKKEESP